VAHHLTPIGAGLRYGRLTLNVSNSAGDKLVDPLDLTPVNLNH
jgi:hypothetical protein